VNRDEATPEVVPGILQHQPQQHHPKNNKDLHGRDQLRNREQRRNNIKNLSKNLSELKAMRKK